MSAVAIVGAVLVPAGLVLLAIGVFQQGAAFLRNAEHQGVNEPLERTRLRGAALRAVLGLGLMLTGFALYAAGR